MSASTPREVYALATKAGDAIPLDVAMPIASWITKEPSLNLVLATNKLRIFSVLCTGFAELVVRDAVSGLENTHVLFPNTVAQLAIRVDTSGDLTITTLDPGEFTIAVNEIVRWSQMDNQNYEAS